ncbi:hypothetical protein M3182_22255 [Mesobacillus maritimus]|uniref:hypothetical protein n=1 Tax=Mesobacillus maritimus TaxID=1643336 RepID=UPI002041440E|nr:hypothetical protein [Mesobacillus maritimus]MCM3588402.1 hypothetical protein [Mesobacillus maritimus]MCM3670172.1 hypothetical protein [Mesobacillus maritimus]
MKRKFLFSILLVVLFLSACGQSALKEPITLLNQNNEEVSFPTGKPTVFFFITTYT